MPLCARCFSFHLSLLLGFILSFMFDDFITSFSVNELAVITISLISPLAIDGTTQFLKLRKSNNKIRVVTGIMAGLICGVDVSFLFVSTYPTLL